MNRLAAALLLADLVKRDLAAYGDVVKRTGVTAE